MDVGVDEAWGDGPITQIDNLHAVWPPDRCGDVGYGVVLDQDLRRPAKRIAEAIKKLAADQHRLAHRCSPEQISLALMTSKNIMRSRRAMPGGTGNPPPAIDRHQAQEHAGGRAEQHRVERPSSRCLPEGDDPRGRERRERVEVGAQNGGNFAGEQVAHHSPADP